MIRCLYYQYRMAQYLEEIETAWPHSLQRHVRECASCRRLGQEQVHLHHSLRAKAPVPTQVASPQLARRIQLARQRASAPRRVPSQIHYLAWSTAAAIVTVVLVRNEFRPEPKAMTPLSQTASLPTAPGRNLPWSAPLPVQEWSRHLEEPMTRELQHLALDAQSVVDALAQQFLVTNPAEGPHLP